VDEAITQSPSRVDASNNDEEMNDNDLKETEIIRAARRQRRRKKQTWKQYDSVTKPNLEDVKNYKISSNHRQ
jgi:hypothetical protein